MYNASSGVEVMDMTIGTEEYTVRMEYPEDSYVNMNQLLNLEIASPMGGMITVGDVAKAVYTDVPNTLVRENGKYQVAIMAYTTEAAKFTAQESIITAVDNAEKNGEFPTGVGQTQSMMNEMIMEEFTAIGKAIITAVFLIFLVMAMQFESPIFSLMVMLSIPFSLIGSFFPAVYIRIDIEYDFSDGCADAGRYRGEQRYPVCRYDQPAKRDNVLE